MLRVDTLETHDFPVRFASKPDLWCHNPSLDYLLFSKFEAHHLKPNHLNNTIKIDLNK